MKERYRLVLRRKSGYYAFDNTTKTFQRVASNGMTTAKPS
jgi:hypothetical protein